MVVVAEGGAVWHPLRTLIAHCSPLSLANPQEIYNEVLNDLLNPAKTNLKLREDPRRGFYVEGITEETLVSLEHALSVIAAGDAHRKVRPVLQGCAASWAGSGAGRGRTGEMRLRAQGVAVGGGVQGWKLRWSHRGGGHFHPPRNPHTVQVSATAFNEGSSRSHTIIRLSIEASDRPEFNADPNAPIGRTISFLHLIDLAGSESAKVRRGGAGRGQWLMPGAGAAAACGKPCVA